MGGTNTTHVVCRHRMRICNTSFAYLFWLANNKKVKYLFWLANNKKVKYPEFCMGYVDETWYVGSDGYKCYPCGLLPNLHI